MKKMTAKDLHIAVKNKATEAGLMVRYGIDSAEELYDVMSRVAPGNLEYFKKEIKKNQKNRARKEDKKEGESIEVQANNTQNKVMDELTENIYEQTELQSSETLPAFSSSSESITIGEESTTEEQDSTEGKQSLQELLDAEKFLSDNCIALENEHNALLTARKKDVQTLSEIQSVLEELQRLLKANQSRMNTVLADYNSKAEQMIKTSSEIKACKEMLADTRAQIEEAKKLKISVFADGIIECDNGKLEYPAETEVQQLISILVLLKEAEELTVRQIKTVAYLILVVKGIDQKYELEFDNDLVKKLYEAAIA